MDQGGVHGARYVAATTPRELRASHRPSHTRAALPCGCRRPRPSPPRASPRPCVPRLEADTPRLAGEGAKAGKQLQGIPSTTLAENRLKRELEIDPAPSKALPLYLIHISETPRPY